jgi:hypothetical protein
MPPPYKTSCLWSHLFLRRASIGGMRREVLREAGSQLLDSRIYIFL